MALRQPQRPQAPRQQSHHAPEVAPAAPALVYKRIQDEEWILFSPQNADGQSVSQTSQTPRTATQPSDFGSLETHVRSQPRGGSRDISDNHTPHGTDFDDDGADLDSLDDGLHAFHHPFSTSSHQLDQSATVLPTHDGFGTFPSATGLQEHLWQFERYNPQRRMKLDRRRSSLQRRLDAMDEGPEVEVEDERTARVERWRLEQSRAVLEEIERETRRRRRRLGMTSSGVVDIARTASNMRDTAMLGKSGDIAGDEPPRSESFWRRITRRVIQDLIGLDETMLSVIFGEELVDTSPTPTEPSPIAAAAAQESRVTFRDNEQTWELKLLERIARELGIVVHQLTEHDGAAFNTYKRSSEEPLEYAGIPRDFAREPSLRQRRRAEKQAAAPLSDGTFSPTVPQTPLTPATEPTDTSLWGIEEEPEAYPSDEQATHLRQEREYWEQDVDVNMVFSFLKKRFSSVPSDSSPSSGGPLPASWATPGEPSASAFGTSPESLRRAEVIRRQHPLVSRAADRAAAAAHSRRRDSLLRRHHMPALLQRRSTSSCASHSTKRSRHSRSASSRHYWDLGRSGSVGSGPAMSSGMGAWGEV